MKTDIISCRSKSKNGVSRGPRMVDDEVPTRMLDNRIFTKSRDASPNIWMISENLTTHRWCVVKQNPNGTWLNKFTGSSMSSTRAGHRQTPEQAFPIGQSQIHAPPRSPFQSDSNSPDCRLQSPLKSPRHLTSKRTQITLNLLRSRSRLRPRSSTPTAIFPQTLPVLSTLFPHLQLLSIKIHNTRITTTPTALSWRRFDRFHFAESSFKESRFS